MTVSADSDQFAFACDRAAVKTDRRAAVGCSRVLAASEDRKHSIFFKCQSAVDLKTGLTGVALSCRRICPCRSLVASQEHFALQLHVAVDHNHRIRVATCFRSIGDIIGVGIDLCILQRRSIL